jgi:hypothetical protein
LFTAARSAEVGHWVAGMRGCVWFAGLLDGESAGLEGVAAGLEGVVRPDAAEAEWPACDPQAASSAAANAPPQVRVAAVTARRAMGELIFMSTLP